MPWMIALAAVLGLAAWFRVTSLESMHFPDGDEAWYGVEALKLARGEAMATRTTAGNLLDPYYVPMEALLLSVVEPSLWVLRVPSAAGGILAVVLMYAVGARRLDRTTGLIAATTLAVLPIAVIFSRVGYYASLTPMFGVVTLALAFRGHRPGVVAMTAAGFLLHPTTVFLLPAPAAVLLARMLRETEGDPGRRRRALAGMASAAGAVVLASVALVLRVPHMRAMASSHEGGGLGGIGYFLEQDRYSPVEFLSLLGRFFLGIGTGMFPMDEGRLRLYDAAFWAVAATVGAAGLVALVRRRQWERVALVVGTAAAMVGYGVVAGRLAFRPQYIYDQRYAMVLVAPAVLSFACLARAMLVEPAGRRRPSARSAQQAALLALAGLMLLCVKANWFDRYTSISRESLWTLRTEAVDAHHQVVSIIGRDLDRRAALGGPRGPKTVVTEHHWIDQPIRYLAGRRPDVRVSCVEGKVPPGPDRDQFLRDQLSAGGYAASGIGQPIEAIVTSMFSPDELVRWDAVGLTGHPTIAVYRLRLPTDGPPAAPDVPPAVARGPGASQGRR